MASHGRRKAPGPRRVVQWLQGQVKIREHEHQLQELADYRHRVSVRLVCAFFLLVKLKLAFATRSGGDGCPLDLLNPVICNFLSNLEARGVQTPKNDDHHIVTVRASAVSFYETLERILGGLLQRVKTEGLDLPLLESRTVKKVGHTNLVEIIEVESV